MLVWRGGGVFRGKAYIVNKVFTIMLFLCHLICDAAVLSSRPTHEHVDHSNVHHEPKTWIAFESDLDPEAQDDNRH